jgi:hypothetical protein
MAITYNWEINPLDAYPTHGGEADVVFSAHWQLNASSGSLENSGSLYTAIELGSQPITYHSGSEFIPFNELTLEIVQGWVEEGMGETQVNNILNTAAKDAGNIGLKSLNKNEDNNYHYNVING